MSSNVKLNELKGKMRAEGHTLRSLAPKIGMSIATLSLKLNGLSDFTSTEIFAICNELHIDYKDIGKYFFPQMFPKGTLSA
jgi:DNA-binding Xre family transcriptional regulator